MNIIIYFSIVLKDFFLFLVNKEIFILTFRIFNLDTSSECYKLFQDNYSVLYAMNNFGIIAYHKLQIQI